MSNEMKSLTLNGITYDSFPDKNAVKTINGETPDENGAVKIPIPETDLSSCVKSVNGVVPDENGNVDTTKPTDAQVSSAVTAWLDAHPDATTTVQDGSVNYEKLTQATRERIGFDLYAIGKKILNREYSRIVLMGDSITDGYGGTGYNGSQSSALSTNTTGYCWANVFKKYVENKFGISVENKGMYGTTANNQVAQAKNYLTGSELVIWLSGTNNRISEAAYNDYVSNMGQYIFDLQTRCADLVVMSCVPAVESNETTRYVTTAEICEVLVKEVTGKTFFLDMRKEFIRYCEVMGLSIDQTLHDGLHPNDTGYWVMFKLLCENIGIPLSTFISYKQNSNWWSETDEPDVPEVTLTRISASYSGGEVTAGTNVTELTGIVVTAYYSDGSSEIVNGYTLSGTIVEGSNTVTVRYEGMTTTFTVTGVSESGDSDIFSVFPDNVSLADENMKLAHSFLIDVEIPIGTISKVKIKGQNAGIHRLYFATKGTDETYTIVQVEELTVANAGAVNELETNIAIEQPCYLIATGENNMYKWYGKETPESLPLLQMSDRPNTPMVVGDTLTVSKTQAGCGLGVWIGMTNVQA